MKKKEFTSYTSVSESLRILQRNVIIAPRAEAISSPESFQRVIFSDVIAKCDVPPLDASHMDGFAVIAEDLRTASISAPARLKLNAGNGVGRTPHHPLKRGEAYSILTGAFLPKFADTVVPIEHAKVEDGNIVVVQRPVEAGSYVFKAGTDVRKGEVILPRGSTVRAQEIGLLASLHMGRVRVYSKPRVGIIATGSELTSRIDNLPAGKVTETHGFVISRLVESAGGVARYFGIAKDEAPDIKLRLRRALAACDIILTMAGTSLGGSDITTECINSLGKPGMLVHGVKIHRGRVMGVAAVRGKPIIVLPGPIQGAVNAFIIFAYPLIAAHLGMGYLEPARIRAVLTEGWQAKKGFEDFAKVVYLKLKRSADGFEATPVVGETEKMTILTSSDAYTLVSENVRSLQQGDTIEAQLLPGFSFAMGSFVSD